jgi:Delta7-sterol 5-desaturase
MRHVRFSATAHADTSPTFTGKSHMTALVHTVFFELSAPELFLLTIGYFLVLYFIVGALFGTVVRFLLNKRLVHTIVRQPLAKGQVRHEIRHSLSSVLVFGFSALPVAGLAREGWITLLPVTFWNTVIGIVLLNAWNEIHFFAVHRLMHTPFFFRHVHKVHHRSLVPTLYSVYSFHWIEALLLSSVPLTLILFCPLSPLALAIYPLTSILLNFAGHSNVRFGNGTGNPVKLFGTAHNEHHAKGRPNFGFATPFLDHLYTRFFNRSTPNKS